MPDTKGPFDIRTFMMGKPKPLDDVLRDSEMAFQLGKMIGATTMVAHWLMRQPDEDSQAMGVKLNEVVGWFFQPEAKKGG